MKLTHQYRLRPTKQQLAQLEEWLETCRRTYNRMLGERFSWCAVLAGVAYPAKLAWENNRCAVNSCSIVSCGIAPLKDKPNYYSQQNNLVPLKAKYPQIGLVQSQVLQNVAKRVDLAYERFVAGDSNNKRSGRPRFKGLGRYRSLTFTQMKQTCISGNRISLPKLASIKLVLHRPIPDGFKIKTGTSNLSKFVSCRVLDYLAVSRVAGWTARHKFRQVSTRAVISLKADGWYISLSLEDATVPVLSPNFDTNNAVGIDMGLSSFLVTSTGETVVIPLAKTCSNLPTRVLKYLLVSFAI